MAGKIEWEREKPDLDRGRKSGRACVCRLQCMHAPIHVYAVVGFLYSYEGGDEYALRMQHIYGNGSDIVVHFYSLCSVYVLLVDMQLITSAKYAK